jgi:hypothetical protein
MKDKTNISYLFNESWKIFKKHFWLLIAVLFLFNFVPLMIYNTYTIYQPFDETLIFNETTNTINWNILINYFLTELTIIIILTLITTFGVISIISLLLGKVKSNNLGDILNEGSKHYIKIILLTLLLILMLIPLYILLIIPGIIFSVYWMFSQYFVIDENEKITKSFGRSMNIVKNNWWAIVGRILLVGLITAGVIFSVSMILGFVTLIIFGLKNVLLGTIPVIAQLVTTGITLLVQLPLTLFTLIFTVNLYKGYKEKYEQNTKQENNQK